MKRQILFLNFIFCFTSCKQDQTETLIIQNCKIDYPIYAKGGIEVIKKNFVSNEWEKESAYRELALCLCSDYIKNPSQKTKIKIIEIYKRKEKFFSRDFTRNVSFDEILKYRKEIFDPKIYID
ncbi:hypothetical protein [Halpernia sp. GG3]